MSVQDTWKKSTLLIVAGAVATVLLYHLAQYAGLWQTDKHIVVSLQQQQVLSDDFERTWQRPPSDEERAAFLKTFVRQEMAYRESRRMDLGHDNTDVRRRLQQELEKRAANEATIDPPTRQDLQDFVQEYRDRYRVDSLLTFRQIYFDNTGNMIGADATARFLLGKLRSQDMPEDISDLGDTSTLPSYIQYAPEFEIRTILGAEFASTLTKAPIGEWIGPIRSILGLHLVYVDERSEGELPDFKDIAREARLDWVQRKKVEAVEALYKRLGEDYDITIE